jgi:hypothetical protein
MLLILYLKNNTKHIYLSIIPSYKIQLETFINETEQKVNAFDPTCMDLSFYLDPEVAPNEKELEQLHLKIKNLEEEVSVKNRFTGCSVCYSFDAS